MFEEIVTVWLFTVDVKLAVIVHAFVTVFHQQLSVQPSNEYVYWSVLCFGFAVLVWFQSVTTFEALEILVPYGTIIDHVVTVPEFVLLETIVIV